MRLCLLLLAAILTGGSIGSSCKREDHPLSSLLSKELYEEAFPHHHAIYTYEALIIAAASFPLFAGEGDPPQRKRELAAFFAHIGHETGNEGGPDEETETSSRPTADVGAPTDKSSAAASSAAASSAAASSAGASSAGASSAAAPSAPYTWGLYHTEELACQDGHCTQYNTAGTSSFQPVPGKSYFGRGPLQITYAYNYGLAGEELGLPLLEKPELVSHDGVAAFRTALWFWMKPQKPKPSCHEVLCGQWKPTSEDLRLHRKPGFGMTINIINGGVECASNAPEVKEQREERIGFYQHMAALLQVSVEKDCDCADMSPYQ